MSLNRVAHFVDIYLFRTGTWIYSQMMYLKNWEAFMLCVLRENLGEFPIEKLYALDSLPVSKRFYNKIVRRIIGYYPFFESAVRHEKPRLFHAHFGQNGYYILPLAKAYRTPLITTHYGHDLSRVPEQEPIWRQRYLRLFEGGDLFLVEGSHMRKQLIELGCPEEKVQVQHLGVDLERFPYSLRHPEPDGQVRILVAGRFTEKKGIPYAVEAYARVCKERPQLHLTVLGDGLNIAADQAVKDQVQAIVERYRISDRVTFLGFQPYPILIEQYYKNHVFLSPSVQAQDGDNEGGSPVTITEAAATGMPVLTTFHCDIPSVVLNGQNGYLVPERNVDALAECIIKVTDEPEIWASMGQRGRTHIEQEYNLRKQVQRLETLYSRLVSG